LTRLSYRRPIWRLDGHNNDSIGRNRIDRCGSSIYTYHYHTSNSTAVDATVVSSTVEYRNKGGRGQALKTPNVVYEYQHQGGIHTAEGVYAGMGPATAPIVRTAKSVANQYEKGEAVTAYIVVGPNSNLEDPRYSYLVGEGPRYYAYYSRH